MDNDTRSGTWLDTFRHLEGMRGAVYATLLLAPFLTGFLLIFAYMPKWLTLDTWKLVLLSGALIVVPVCQCAGLYARLVLPKLPQGRGSARAVAYVFYTGAWIASMSATSVVVIGALAKWFYPSAHGRYVLPVLIIVLFALQAWVFLTVKMPRKPWKCLLIENALKRHAESAAKLAESQMSEEARRARKHTRIELRADVEEGS